MNSRIAIRDSTVRRSELKRTAFGRNRRDWWRRFGFRWERIRGRRFRRNRFRCWVRSGPRFRRFRKVRVSNHARDLLQATLRIGNERSERDTALPFTHHTIGGCRSAWFLVIHLISAMATNAVMIDAPMIASPHSTHDGSTAITLLLEPSVHSVYPKRFFSISAKPEAFRGALG